MKAVVQRVAWAQVEVEGRLVGRIERGLLVYVGVGEGDDAAAPAKLAEKVAFLRIFEDGEGKLNLSVKDIGGGVLGIPNFTLLGDARRGRRPDFTGAARPEQAQPLYEAFLAALRQAGCTVAGGQFRAHMDIRSQADGPINILLEVPSRE
ncbi:MAG: D-aminoacyl-tRNA deacylase [Planctomycetota bacterium]|nr:D-aminoacyl-tRNA deacylase [Planctomycetota bacterium]